MKNKKTVALTTLGCKVNQFETAAFKSGFEQRGLEVVNFDEQADIYVVNTCAVTAKAGAQSRRLIRRALRTNPEARLVVTGCYAQVASDEVMELTELPLCLVGNDEKEKLVQIALAALAVDAEWGHEKHIGEVGKQKEIARLPVSGFGARTRAFLKVQDGCNNFCTYCIVPYARGRSRSLPPDEVLNQVGVLVEQGYKELVVTGIHVGGYGDDLDISCRLLDLLKMITAAHPQVRFRISSLEPTEINRELLQFMAATGNMMPHLHIPLQSGDDAILKKMNRRYSAADFGAIVRLVHEILSDPAIGVDVLTGFPGETDEQFTNTLELLRSLPITYLHAFPYSRRPGTVAAAMKEQLPSQVKDERVALFRRLDREKRRLFYQGNLGRIARVLGESGGSDEKTLRGFSENYIPVRFGADMSLANLVVNVRLDRFVKNEVMGSLIENNA